jgi:hypothetical protein
MLFNNILSKTFRGVGIYLKCTCAIGTTYGITLCCKTPIYEETDWREKTAILVASNYVTIVMPPMFGYHLFKHKIKDNEYKKL